ncbi:MAG: thymidine phosphorylase [Gammaproteobacteria bacterium]
MLFVDVIRAKRDGAALSAEQIAFFVRGLTDGSIPAEQVSALAMAICLRSMSFDEAAALTTAMAASGTILKWRAEELGGPVVDKHSTGGIGDKVSFLLAPIVAACGGFVPMISGRGLGHTGGTLDKIDSIPGYRSTPDLATFEKVVRSVGCAIIGQTADLAPADRRFYAIRDVTGTVESIPLITASILSKKIAAGLDALVMDVKVGSGAFMASMDQAQALARSIIGTAASAGLKTRALITDMNETLGLTAGNAVEIRESVAYLQNARREPRLNEVVLALCAEMLVLSGLEKEREAARQRADAAVTSGRAAEIFGRMVAALGGPADFIERPDGYLPVAPVTSAVQPATSGYLAAVNARAVGNAIIGLGGGRRRADDKLDLSVGFTDIAPIGAAVDPARPLAVVHAASDADAQRAIHNLRAACTITPSPPPPRPVIYETSGEED